MKVGHWAVALGTVLCAVTLAACGGGSGSGGESSASREEAGLAFAECMRAHGVEVEDPKSGKSITIGSDDPKTKKALAACDGKLGGQGQELSAEEGEEFKEGVLAFTECIREEGIPMGDPEFLGPGKFHFDISKVDTSSPAFEAAAEACKDKFPELSEEGLYIGG
jgi:hypothetical protein